MYVLHGWYAFISQHIYQWWCILNIVKQRRNTMNTEDYIREQMHKREQKQMFITSLIVMVCLFTALVIWELSQ